MFEYNDDLKILDDYFPAWTFSDDAESVIINGTQYPYETTLSNSVSDSQCMRVEIDGKYYYFG